MKLKHNLKSLPRIPNKYKYLYICVNKIEKEVYIGITCSPQDRIRRHLKGIHKTFFNKNINNFFSSGIKMSNSKAQKAESIEIQKYRLKKYKIINIAKAGSLGGGPLIWTKKACLKDAQKYKSKMEWYKNSPGAYSAAKRKRWLAECSKHMIKHSKPKGYWTFKKCIQDAKKYKTIKEWSENSVSAYSIAKRNGWLKDCTVHMIRLLKPKGFWTKSLCYKEAIKYQNQKDWKLHHRASFSIASKRGWIPSLTKHMVKCKQKENKPELNMKIKKLFLEGYSQRKISIKLKCNRITVRKKINKLKILGEL